MTDFRMEHDVMEAGFFDKFRLYGPWNDGAHRFHLNLNRFSRADTSDADFHDHPFAFRSIILYGGYTEEVLNPDLGGYVERCERRVGDSLWVPARHTHRIIKLHADECWTAFLPEEATQEVSFYRVHNGMVQRRPAGGGDWRPLKA